MSPRARDEQAPKSDITPFEALDILDAAAKRGIDVVALVARAPDHCTTRYQRRLWAAQQLSAKEAS